MRLPLALSIDSRDGSSTRDARATNVLAEQDAGSRFAEVRPAITQYAALGTALTGQGVQCFNGTFCAIYGARLYKPIGGTMGTGVAITSASTTLAFDFTQSPT